ncbi:hypothetical protein C8E84_3097 [Ornithinibacter aureus]|nr:hypothetical protein C8E84_3097 [Ornithinibacter aureus]
MPSPQSVDQYAGMARTSTVITDRLEEALRSQFPVRICRDQSWAPDDVPGFVVSLSDGWVAVQRLVDAVYVDGYDVVRIQDVTEVEADGEGGYIERAVAGLGRREPRFHLPVGAAADAVLRAAAEHAALVCVHLEAAEDYPLLVGRVVRFGTRKFDLQLIGPRGVWETDAARLWYRDVTRVGLGDRYSSALARFGDRAPVPGRHRDLQSFCSGEES